MKESQTTLFRGLFQVRVLKTGAFCLPRAWRSLLAAKDPIYWVQGFLERKLLVVSKPVLDAERARLCGLPDDSDTQWMRKLVEGAKQVQVDARGRLVIPVDLRIWSGIGSHATLKGCLRQIEISKSEEKGKANEKNDSGSNYDVGVGTWSG